MKHIVILFLSEIHTNRDKSTLTESIYERKNGMSHTVIQTNETALRALSDMLDKKGEHIDCLFYFRSGRVKKALVYTDDQGARIQETHEEIFLRRIRGEYGDMPCKAIDFDETGDAEKGIRQVTKMAKTIRDYMDETSWHVKDVLLHADMTGGPRNAAMMMLSVMQLLKYQGIQTGQVVYSGWDRETHRVWIENATEIYRMFNLVSGADEFVNFGSVKEIETYFSGHEPSRELKNLLKSMREFSDAIKICRTSVMFEAMEQLRKALAAFEKAGKANLREELFSQILEIFKRDYGMLLNKHIDDINLIDWCVKKGFLQQALTLCTEWLPLYFVNKYIYYPADEEDVQRRKDTERDHKKERWEYYFVVSYARDKLGKIQGGRDMGIKRLFADRLVATEYNQGNAIRVLEQYFYLKDLRNEINHATEKKNLKNEEIAAKIDKIIKDIKYLTREKR